MPALRLADVTLDYEQFGEGPDIVWLSGGGGLGTAWHEYQIPSFEGSFRTRRSTTAGSARPCATRRRPGR